MRRLRPLVWCLTLALAASGAAAGDEPEADAPAVVAFTLDSSGSLRPGDIDTTRRLAREILAALPAGSRAAVFSFDDQSRLLLDATPDVADVERALAGVRIAGHYTALYDALFDASRYLVTREEPRRAIVLVTDGKDENSAVLLEDGLSIAREQHIPVFAVGVGHIQEQVLRRIAKLTGGDYAPADEVDGAALAREIRALPARRITAEEAAAPDEAPPVTAASEPPTPSGPSPRRLVLWGALGLGLLLAAAAAILAVRGKRPPDTPTRGMDASPLPGESRGEEPAPDADATLLTRSPLAAGGAGETVVLTASPVLRITQGRSAGQVFPLSETSATSVGRAPTNDIALDDDAASGQHCRIRSEAGRFVLYDLESTNGTYVNDRRVGRQLLSEGDTIRVGETLLEYRAFGRRG